MNSDFGRHLLLMAFHGGSLDPKSVYETVIAHLRALPVQLWSMIRD
jgi:hypothetical protein